MENLKFRLVKDGVVVGYERQSCNTTDPTISYVEHKGLQEWSDWGNVWGECALGDDWIDYDTKELFSGQVDKNGKELYVNDTIEIRTHFREASEILKIKWKCGGAVVEYKGDLYLVGEYRPEELTFVGREK